MHAGYIEPGHGWKGKQLWINHDKDLDEMYTLYAAKKAVLLWCYLPGNDKKSKRSQAPSSGEAPASKRAKCAQANDDKISKARKVFETLLEKHSAWYKSEQLHAWAQLIEMKKHESLETPPDLPFFRGNRSPRQKEGDKAPTTPSKTATNMVGISPGKKIHMRTECIEQLQKVGDLLEKGNISQEQYDKLQKAIMNDIHKF